MAERKVINKYYPPNFDPEKIPRAKGSGGQFTVRLMTPFSMRCNTCLEYIYKGRKFNARKETAYGEDYLGIRIFRFYIRCPICASEITFKTDPKNADYVAEHGATRNFEPWREEQAAEAKRKRLREEEEVFNPMKALENRTMDSKKEIDVLDALDEIRSMNARYHKVDHDKLLEDFATEKMASNRKDREEEDKKIDEFLKNRPHKPNPLINFTIQKPIVKKTAADLGIILKK